MNNQNIVSDLQKNFPLSPKKFWKKIIEKAISAFMFGFILSATASTVYVGIFISKKFSVPLLLVLAGVLFIIGFLIVILPYIIYVREYIKRYYYSADDNFLTIKKGVFAPAEIHVQWQKIQDVYVDQDILDRMMGLCDVHIASATFSSGIAAHIDGVDIDVANGLKDYLLNKVVGVSRGGTMSTMHSDTTATTNEQKPKNIEINLSEEISSDVYPLTGKWFMISLIQILAGFLTISVIVSTSILVSNNNGDFGGLYVFLGIILLTTTARIIGLFLWKQNYKFSFMSDNIYFRSGMLSLSEKHMPYSTIQDVTIKQDIISKIFGIAEVRIENATSVPNFSSNKNFEISNAVVIQGVSKSDADKITNLLRENVLGRLDARHGL